MQKLPDADVIVSFVVLSGGAECSNTNDDPLEVLELQLQQFGELISEGDEGGRHVRRTVLTGEHLLPTGSLN